MLFSYVYKTSDGVRHEARVEASSRDMAFSVLRGEGIRPIKMWAADGSRANGEVKGIRRRVAVAIGIACVLLGAAGAFLVMHERAVVFYRADGSVGKGRNGNRVQAMTRRQIRGSSDKVQRLLANDSQSLFHYRGEVLLAHYAQPGRIVPESVTMPGIEILTEDLLSSLKVPLYTFPGEMSECVELKSIVAGMKEELRMFLAAGGTIKEYVSRLEERQKMEIAYREQAALKLDEACGKGNEKKAFRVWKEQNGWLQAMGIERLPLPSSIASGSENE